MSPRVASGASMRLRSKAGVLRMVMRPATPLAKASRLLGICHCPWLSGVNGELGQLLVCEPRMSSIDFSTMSASARDCTGCTKTMCELCDMGTACACVASSRLALKIWSPLMVGSMPAVVRRRNIDRLIRRHCPVRSFVLIFPRVRRGAYVISWMTCLQTGHQQSTDRLPRRQPPKYRLSVEWRCYCPRHCWQSP